MWNLSKTLLTKLVTLSSLLIGHTVSAQLPNLPYEVPVIVGNWWQIAQDEPNISPYSYLNPRPLNSSAVDLTVFRAADDTWRLISCIRNVANIPGNRLFYEWRSDSLTATNWTPVGVFGTSYDIGYNADTASPLASIQAPHAFKSGDKYYMFYNSYSAAYCMISDDGINWTRHRNVSNSYRFYNLARDTALFNVDGTWHAYFTQNQDQYYPVPYIGVRSAPTPEGPWSADIRVANNIGNPESPFMVTRNGLYYLWQQGIVYVSDDPENFRDRVRLTSMWTFKYAPEIIEHNGEYYAVTYSNGIHVARIEWRTPANTPPIQFFGITGGSGTVGSSYRGELRTYLGVGGPYFSIIAGQLPPGLSIQGEEIVGTPTQAGTYSFTIRATDDRGNNAQINQTIVIAPSSSSSSSSGGSSSSSSGGSSSSSGGSSSSSSGSGFSHYRIEITQGTSGAWGRITEIDWISDGTEHPTPHFTSNTASVSATGNNGWQAYDASTATYWDMMGTTGTISVNLGAAQTVTAVRIRAQANNRAPASFILSGSTDGNTWTELGSFSGLTTTTWTNLDQTFELEVLDTTPVITTTSLPNGTLGIPYSQTLTATGGDGTLTWSISAGSLPAGLTLSGAGVISGAPTVEVSSNFTVRVEDEDEDTDTQALTINISQGFTMLQLQVTQGTSGAWGRVGEVDWLVSGSAYPIPHFSGSTSSVTSTGTAGWEAYDNSTASNSYWDLGGTTGTLTLTLSEAIAPTTVRIRVPDAGRAPASFTLRGSNDGNTWTILGSISGETQSAWNSLDRTFTLNY